MGRLWREIGDTLPKRHVRPSLSNCYTSLATILINLTINKAKAASAATLAPCALEHALRELGTGELQAGRNGRPVVGTSPPSSESNRLSGPGTSSIGGCGEALGRRLILRDRVLFSAIGVRSFSGRGRKSKPHRAVGPAPRSWSAAKRNLHDRIVRRASESLAVRTRYRTRGAGGGPVPVRQ